MKTVVLMPVRNEAWILPFTLGVISMYADHIIVADQMSTDGSRDIYAQFPKVKVIDNKRQGHSNEIRWELLKEAHNIPGNHLILCIDADEIIPPQKVFTLIEQAEKVGVGHAFSLPWIQLWGTPRTYRTDGPWKNNFKQCAFYDDRIMDYPHVSVVNDHTGRIPPVSPGHLHELDDIPLLHLQFLALQRMRIKQAWYRASELIKSPRKARAINRKYSATITNDQITTSSTPDEWLQGMTIPDFDDTSDMTRLNELKAWFTEKGITFFEPLEIWDIPELGSMFEHETGRKPRTKTYSPTLITIYSKLKKLIS